LNTFKTVSFSQFIPKKTKSVFKNFSEKMALAVYESKKAQEQIKFFIR